jgi:hypothetical protein
MLSEIVVNAIKIRARLRPRARRLVLGGFYKKGIKNALI